MVKIGIVGSRRRDTEADFEKVKAVFAQLREKYDGDVVIVSGGCPKGADQFAERLARELGLSIAVWPVNMDAVNKAKARGIYWRTAFGQEAYKRNRRIAGDCDELIACVAADRRGGTENTIGYVMGLGKPVHLC